MKDVNDFWKNKNVLVTGCTGFKGSWLSLSLNLLGANVVGCGLEPPLTDSIFRLFNLQKTIKLEIFNVCDYDRLNKLIEEYEVEIIFHLAAQPIVAESLQDPYSTFYTNTIGTLNALQSTVTNKTVTTFINITSDKCYKPSKESSFYVESSPLGGKDPYSASKACSEIITGSYADCFLNENNIGVATARSGNIIGGGDFSRYRLIPDLVRSRNSQKPVTLRKPDAVRPWIYVIDTIRGYLLLAQKLVHNPKKFNGAWNFSPDRANHKNVRYLVEKFNEVSNWQLPIEYELQAKIIENDFLALDSSKARSLLNWAPTFDLDSSIKQTFFWYENYTKGADMLATSIEHIEEFL